MAILNTVSILQNFKGGLIPTKTSIPPGLEGDGVLYAAGFDPTCDPTKHHLNKTKHGGSENAVRI